MQTNKCFVITHRGLEPSNLDFYPESSYEAFKDHLERGFGIEFDVNFAKDGLIVFHDSDLNRITKGDNKSLFSELGLEEIKKIRYGKNENGRFITFSQTGNTLFHPHCYAAEGLYVAGNYFNNRVYLDAAKKIGEDLGLKAYKLQIHVGKEAGQEVFHLHVHLIPRYFEDNLPKFSTKKYKEDEASVVAQKIISAIP